MEEQSHQDRESAPDAIPLIEGVVSVDSVGRGEQLGMKGLAEIVDHSLETLLNDHLHLNAEALAEESTWTAARTSLIDSLNALGPGSEYNTEARLLNRSQTQLHLFITIWSDGEIAATCELLLSNLTVGTLEEAPIPQRCHVAIERMFEAQEGLPLPFNAGKTVGIST